MAVLARFGGIGGVSRSQPGHGLVVCCRAWTASAEPSDGLSVAGAHRCWPCALGGIGRRRLRACRAYGQCASVGTSLRPPADRLGALSLGIPSPSSRALWHAERTGGHFALVVFGGNGPRSGADALANSNAGLLSLRCDVWRQRARGARAGR